MRLEGRQFNLTQHGTLTRVSKVRTKRNSARPRRQDVIHVPLALLLANGGVAEQSGGEEHFMGGLEDALQV